MAKVIIHLRDHELKALKDPAQREPRVPKPQAALIIRRDHENLGPIPVEQSVPSNQTDLLSEVPDKPVLEGG
ncbi:MAG: hypothetical protein C3F07_01860 [Anaerolineales bacterium]|nr:hypothetical protein [Anaerolineae bacterium]PWB77585.1 MAG: hypothetical protein C3F07_01860 [Anaerolineales bacterium]